VTRSLFPHLLSRMLLCGAYAKVTSPGNTVTFHDVMVRVLHGMSDSMRAELARRGVELRVMVRVLRDGRL
jgi:hypothetical protein